MTTESGGFDVQTTGGEQSHPASVHGDIAAPLSTSAEMSGGEPEVPENAAPQGTLLHPCGITLVGAWSERDQAIVFPPCPKCDRQRGEPVRCQAEARQADKINQALNVCDLVERNPEGWGGSQAVSLARTIRQALTGQPVTPHANYANATDSCPTCGGDADHRPGGRLCYGEADPNG